MRREWRFGGGISGISLARTNKQHLLGCLIYWYTDILDHLVVLRLCFSLVVCSLVLSYFKLRPSCKSGYSYINLHLWDRFSKNDLTTHVEYDEGMALKDLFHRRVNQVQPSLPVATSQSPRAATHTYMQDSRSNHSLVGSLDDALSWQMWQRKLES